MLKKFFLCVICVAGCYLFMVAGVKEEAYSGTLIGTWMRQDKQCSVTIYTQGDKYCGKITWLQNPNVNGKPAMDTHNNRPLMGMQVLQGFSYEGHKIWSEGKMYEPAEGKDHSCKIKLVDYNTLEVHDFTGLPIFGGQNETWKRVK